MFIHIAPEQYSFRGYEGGNSDSYANRDDYDLVGQIKILDGREAHISSVHGKITPQAKQNLFSQLKSMGIHTVVWERHGKRKTYQL